MWVPFVFVVSGLFIMYVAWVFEHPERHLQFVRALDPTGYTILSCYDKLSKGGTVTPDDDGFATVAEIILRELKVTVPSQLFPQVAARPAAELLQEGRLKVLEVSSAGESGIAIGGIPVGQTRLTDVLITYSLDQENRDGGPFTITGFRKELVEIYVDKPLFQWSFLFFLLGLAFSVVSTFSAMRWQNPSLPSYYREL